MRGAGRGLGLETAHQSFGTLPWPELIAPAVELARMGVELTRPQAYLHAILDLILRHTPEGRAIYGGGNRLVAGDRLVMTDLAGTLEQLAATGASDLYTGELARAVVDHVRAGHGAITLEDLFVSRHPLRPVRAGYREHELASNPAPSSGGILIAYALKLLDRLESMEPEAPTRWPSSAPSCASRRAPAPTVSTAGSTAAAPNGSWTRGSTRRRPRPRRRRDRRDGTRHAGRDDAHLRRRRRGNAAALTISTGSGSGVVVPGTGINLNNMLGEFDSPRRRRPEAGCRA